VPAPEPPPEPIHRAEWRLGDAGGSDDRATYRCACGFCFEAHVTTAVICPHCHSPQAW
jgi:hypothetical protein